MDCSGMKYPLKIAFSIACLIFYTITCFYLSYFISDLNPFTGSPFSGMLNSNTMIKLIVKSLLPLFFLIDDSGEFGNILIGIISSLFLVQILWRMMYPPQIDKFFNMISKGSSLVLFWISFILTLHSNLDSGEIDNLSMLYCGIGCVFILFIVGIDSRGWVLSNLHYNILKTEDENTIVKFIYRIIPFIEASDSREHRLELHGVFKVLFENATALDMKCVTMLKEHLSCKNKKPEEYKLECYKVLYELLEELMNRFPKGDYIRLLIAFIAHTKLGLRWVALYKVQHVSKNNRRSRLVLSAIAFLTMIENDMKDKELRKREISGLDIPTVIKFQNRFFTLTRAILEGTNLHYEFWVELREEKPMIRKLQKLGSQVTLNLDLCRTYYRSVTDMYQNHLKTLLIYGNFTNYVLNDTEETRKLLDKADYVEKSTNLNKQFTEDKRLKYSENANFSIIIVSGNHSEIGLIKAINYETISLTGFTLEELKNRNIDVILPKSIKPYHNDFMKKYFQKNDGNVMNKERMVLVVDYANFIIPCSLLIKPIPSLERGIEVIGMLSKESSLFTKFEDENRGDYHYIAFSKDSGNIIGVSKGCYYEFGISPDITEGSTKDPSMVLKMNTIFPEFSDPAMLERLSGSASKHTTMIDTSKIPGMFYIDKSDLVKFGPPRRGKLAFKSVLVKFEVSPEEKYGKEDVSIVIIKFCLERAIADLESAKKLIQNQGLHRMISGLSNNIHDGQQIIEEAERAFKQEEKERHEREEKHRKYLLQRFKKDVETSTQDRERKIREKKIMLGKKSVPGSIIFFKYSLIGAFIFIILVCLVEEYIKFGIKSIVNEGQLGIISVGMKSSKIVRIAYHTRLINLISIGRIGTGGSINFDRQNLRLKNKLGELIMSQSEFESQYLSYLSRGTMPPQSVDDYIMSSQGILSETVPLNFIYAISTLINKAQLINERTQEMLQENNLIDSVRMAYNFISLNYYRNFLKINNLNQEQFSEGLESEISKKSIINIVVIIVESVILLICIVIMIPLVVKIRKGMNDVMGLFSYVTNDQIVELAKRCQTFKDKYLKEVDLHKVVLNNNEGEDEEAKKDENSMPEDDDEKSSLIDFFSVQSKSVIDNSAHANSYKGDDSMNRSYQKEGIEEDLKRLQENELYLNATPKAPLKGLNFDSVLKGFGEESKDSEKDVKEYINDINKAEKRSHPPNNKINIQEDDDSGDEEENGTDQVADDLIKEAITKIEKDHDGNEEERLDRMEILQATSERFVEAYLLKGCLTWIVLFGMFLLNFYLNYSLSSASVKTTQHFDLINKLKTNLFYMESYTLESVNANKTITLDNIDLIEASGDKIYTLLNELNTNAKDPFHFMLSNYHELYTQILNSNLCQYFFSISPQYNFTSKLVVDQRLLDKRILHERNVYFDDEGY